jgi:hypothetical protein
MIPRSYISQWQEQVPWKAFSQVEQDIQIDYDQIMQKEFFAEMQDHETNFRWGSNLIPFCLDVPWTGIDGHACCNRTFL